MISRLASVKWAIFGVLKFIFDIIFQSCFFNLMAKMISRLASVIMVVGFLDFRWSYFQQACPKCNRQGDVGAVQNDHIHRLLVFRRQRDVGAVQNDHIHWLLNLLFPKFFTKFRAPKSSCRRPLFVLILPTEAGIKAITERTLYCHHVAVFTSSWSTF
jgi:hypothetical protein